MVEDVIGCFILYVFLMRKISVMGVSGGAERFLGEVGGINIRNELPGKKYANAVNVNRATLIKEEWRCLEVG
jgi:hypothetical protein